MSRELASICVLASAVDNDPQDVLDPASADLGVEHAFGLSSPDEVDDGIVGRYCPGSAMFCSPTETTSPMPSATPSRRH